MADLRLMRSRIADVGAMSPFRMNDRLRSDPKPSIVPAQSRHYDRVWNVRRSARYALVAGSHVIGRESQVPKRETPSPARAVPADWQSLFNDRYGTHCTVTAVGPI